MSTHPKKLNLVQSGHIVINGHILTLLQIDVDVDDREKKTIAVPYYSCTVIFFVHPEHTF